MQLLHVRHATSIIYYSGIRILVDPVFAAKETYPAIPMTPNRRRNPMVDLQTDIDTLQKVDMILSTHTHNDHFDNMAIELLDKKLPLICQSGDEEFFTEKGFLSVLPVQNTLKCGNIVITRVNAKHGTGAILKQMGNTSGYILQSESEPIIYITGDTIFYEEIKENIQKYKPDILIMNAGSPKFLNSKRIVMNIMDLEETMKVNPELTFVIVHLDTFNHCIETRADIREYFSPDKLKEIGVRKFIIPEDNELLGADIFQSL